MKVRDLKKLLENAPDEAPVMVPAPDHNYREAHCLLTIGLMDDHNNWAEDCGEETTLGVEYGKRLPILLIGA